MSLRELLTLLAACSICAVPSALFAEVKPTPAESARLAAETLLQDVARAGERLVAVGDHGIIVLSDDEGRSWRQVASPVDIMLTAVAFADASHGAAVGHDETILATQDGGETWQLRQFRPEAEQPLLDLWLSSDGSGIAIGAYSSVYVTSDGGANWTARPLDMHASATADGAKLAVAAEEEDLPPDYHYNAIAANSAYLYIAAEAGQVYRSDDRGLTWHSLPSPYNGSFFGVLPLAGDSVLVFGLRGNLFRSDDAGASWRAIETGTVAMITDGVAIGDDVVLTGLSGVLLHSADGGRTFARVQRDDRQGIAAIVTIGDRVVTVGEAGARSDPRERVPTAQVPR
ncbi:MAG: YCF48-related protein [Steroidobacteraceae bacterium]